MKIKQVHKKEMINMLSKEDKIANKKDRLEKALYNWLNETEKVEEDVLNLIDHNNVPKSKISRSISTMKNRLVTLENNLRKY